MTKYKLGVSARGLFTASILASAFLLYSGAEDATAESMGCGTYTECVPQCPNQDSLEETCSDHAGSHGCNIAKATCGISYISCGWGKSKITCEYSQGGGNT